MPRDTIERAIKKATGAGAGEDYVEVRYEGYGPAGVAVIVEALTDNRNRTASDVRSAFNKHGGALGETNSVSFMFNRLGVIQLPRIRRQRRRHAGSGDRGRRRQRRERRARATRSPARVEDFFAVRDALEARFGAARECQAGLAPDHRRDTRRGTRGRPAQADRRARGQ